MATSAQVYKKFDSAFSNVSASCVCLRGKSVARVVFKFGSSGRVTCFLQVWGTAMVTGWVDGGGYDKQTASAAEAAEKLVELSEEEAAQWPETAEVVNLMKKLVDEGHRWNDQLKELGFDVSHVI